MKSVCIFGPPGTGKTRALVDVAEEHAKKNNVLFLSFTKAAALEATSRIKSKRVTASTLHAFAYKTLGLGRGSVVDADKLVDFTSVVGVPIKTKRDEQPQIGDEYLEVISFANNKLLDRGDAYEEFGRPGNPKQFEQFANSYDLWKKTYGYIDFNDMLMNLTNIKSCIPAAPTIILDEAQDSSKLQWAAFNKIMENARSVYVAGDDDQAIYEWSGADPHAMVEFAGENNSTINILSASHRMPPSVHNFVHDVILNQMGRRQEKSFHPRLPNEGDDLGVTRYGSILDVDLHNLNGETLILVRDRFASLGMQRELNATLVPYSIAGGYSPWDNIKAWAIRGFISLNSGSELNHRMQHAISVVTGRQIGDYEGALGRDWRTQIRMSGNQFDFYDSIADKIMDPMAVTLSTIHQAKGREADHVIVNLELTDRVVENALVNRDAELRVMYVACTRAKKKLSLCGENMLISGNKYE